MDVKNTKNRGTRSIIIDRDQYHNLLSMVKSSKEDISLALECIKNMDAKANVLPILLLRKNASGNFDDWIKTCKKHIAYQYSLGIDKDRKNVTYSEIYEVTKNKDANISQNHIDIFLEEMNNFFKKHMIKFDFIDDVNINIKLK